MSVSLSLDTAEGESDHSRPALIPVAAASFNSTVNSNLSSLESRQPRASGWKSPSQFLSLFHCTSRF